MMTDWRSSASMMLTVNVGDGPTALCEPRAWRASIGSKPRHTGLGLGLKRSGGDVGHCWRDQRPAVLGIGGVKRPPSPRGPVGPVPPHTSISEPVHTAM